MNLESYDTKNRYKLLLMINKNQNHLSGQSNKQICKPFYLFSVCNITPIFLVFLSLLDTFLKWHYKLPFSLFIRPLYYLSQSYSQSFLIFVIFMFCQTSYTSLSFHTTKNDQMLSSSFLQFVFSHVCSIYKFAVNHEFIKIQSKTIFAICCHIVCLCHL